MITLEIKKIVLVFFVLCLSLTNTSTASELIHKFGNPSFSKEGYSQHALSIECKNQEKVNVWESYKQAEENSNNYEPVVVIKRNNAKPLVVVDAEYFVSLFNK